MNAKKAAAMIAIKADSKSLDRDLANAKKTLRGFGSDVKKFGGKIMGGGAGALSKIGTGLGIQASSAITEGIASALEFERSLVRFQVAAKKTDLEMSRMRDSIREVSRATAVSSDDILAGVQSYIDLTGDVSGATSAMSSFARIAQASGAKVSDVATATAALRIAMKLDPSQVEAVFSGLITQGEKGAVSLKDFAGELATLAPQFATFAGGTGADGIRDMGAAFQVIRNGAGSASQAATQFEALMGELVASHKKLGAIGVKVFQKDGKSLRSFAEIAEDLAKNTKLDSVATLQDVFGRKESQQAVRSIRDQIGAMRELRVAGENTTAVQQNLNTVLGSASGKLDVAMNNLKLSIAEAFTPERIAKFASALEKVVSIADRVLGVFDRLDDAGVEFASPFDQRSVMQRVEDRVLGNDGPQNANDADYVAKIRDIKGRGSRDERIREAVQAANAPGVRNEGVRAAGRAYIDKKGVSQEEQDRARDQILKQYADTAPALKALTATLQGLADVGITVKMDGSAVAKTVGNAPAANRGGG